VALYKRLDTKTKMHHIFTLCGFKLVSICHGSNNSGL